jgi:ABC-2 type transport system permease protein
MSPSKTLSVAYREFMATVVTKGFVFGVLILPLMVGVLTFVIKKTMNNKAPQIDGEIAVVDATGQVAERLREYLSPEALAKRRLEYERRLAEKAPAGVDKLIEASGESGRLALQAALGEVPQLRVVELPAGTDLEQAKEPLKADKAQKGERIALVVMSPDALVRPPVGESGDGESAKQPYDLFVRAKFDDRIEDEITEGVNDAIVAARVKAEGLDRAYVRSLTHVPHVKSRTVTAKGESDTNPFFNVFLPMAFMGLLMLAVMMGAQSLLLTTIEEKSNRVVEVLLSAVSPMELMAGKVFGQLCVGFVGLGLYFGMGVVGLVSFSMLGLLEPKLVFFLCAFYVIQYFIVASLLAAIGSAVNDIREAQNLTTPVMMLFMIPWMAWFVIARDPNSVFSTVLSFTPLINLPAMLLRITSTTPPPEWQVWLSMGVGLVSAWLAIWFASKVFRIGLLMYGKPPNLATLIRWVRMA